MPLPPNNDNNRRTDIINNIDNGRPNIFDDIDIVNIIDNNGSPNNNHDGRSVPMPLSEFLRHIGGAMHRYPMQHQHQYAAGGLPADDNINPGTININAPARM